MLNHVKRRRFEDRIDGLNVIVIDSGYIDFIFLRVSRSTPDAID